MMSLVVSVVILRLLVRKYVSIRFGRVVYLLVLSELIVYRVMVCVERWMDVCLG